jgi:hypothetical protein
VSRSSLADGTDNRRMASDRTPISVPLVEGLQRVDARPHAVGDGIRIGGVPPRKQLGRSAWSVGVASQDTGTDAA